MLLKIKVNVVHVGHFQPLVFWNQILLFLQES
ncbi:UNVERIFIED_CONTAM: hypothetical protein GTU68_034394 [Idotea baltica]|nr:hypothetical protein [Idotea baltica]